MKPTDKQIEKARKIIAIVNKNKRWEGKTKEERKAHSDMMNSKRRLSTGKSENPLPGSEDMGQ